MITKLYIYTTIFLVIIYIGFNKSKPFLNFFSVRKKIAIITTFIQIESIPFFFNQKKNSFIFYFY